MTRRNGNRLIIPTRFGKISGQLKKASPDSTVYAREWLGVPFAAPPIGSLRWRAPRDPIAWDGVLSASTMPEPCVQYLGFGDAPGIFGQEDCLYMNIYRPDSDERHLPVYFWIHGGGNTCGSIREYQGDQTSIKLNAVVVLVQYRVGWLGFFNHPSLEIDAEMPEDISGNYAYLDLIKALEWVQDNIESFGGNPSLVTVAGESAGAINSVALLGASKVKEKNLIHRVISQSGGFTASRTIEEGQKRGRSLISALFEKDPNQPELITKESVREYLLSQNGNAFAAINIPIHGGIGSPIVDGIVFKEHLDDQFQNGTYHKVPMIIGSSRDEFTLFASEEEPYRRLYDAARGKIDQSEVHLSEEELNSYSMYSGILSKIWRFRNDDLSEKIRRYQEDVFSYTLNWDGNDDSFYQFVFGATHAMSIVFFHGDWNSGAFVPFGFDDNNLSGREDLSNSIISYQKQFIRTGNPGNGWENELAVKWLPWSNEQDEYKRISLDANQYHAIIKLHKERQFAKGIHAEIDAIKSPELKEKTQETASSFFGFE